MAARTQSVEIYQYDVLSGTSVNIPNSGSIATIAAGSLVRFAFRYEGGAAVTLSATDSAGATYTVVQDTSLDSPSVAVIYKHNHPGGTSVVITVTLSSSRSYIQAYGEVLSGSVGELDPLTGTYGTDSAITPAQCTVTGVSGDCDLFMAAGTYSGSTWAGSGGSSRIPASDAPSPPNYAAAFKQHFTGSGDKTIAITDPAGGAFRAIALAFLDDAGTGGGGGSSVGAAAHYYRTMRQA
mgnify:CR=1 FL=1